MSVRAIDVSRWQGPIDWHAVAGDGVRGAWIKVGGADGGLYRDSRAAENLTGAQDAGLPYGTYYFFVPAIGDGRRQAQHAVACGHGRGQLWPSPDIEVNPNGLTPRQIDQFAAEVCAETLRLTGRDSLIYTNVNVGLGSTDLAPAHCPLWIANYGTNTPGSRAPAFAPRLPARWSAWSVWQINSTTRVAGIPGNTVDQNVVTDEFWAVMAAPSAPPEEEDDVPVETHILITKPGSRWFETHGGEPGHQGMFKALNTDQLVRAMAPKEVDGHQAIHAFVSATGGPSGLHVDGEVDDWIFEDRTLLPREWPAATSAPPTVASLTPEQVTQITAQLLEALDIDPVELAKFTADELADRLDA